MQPLHRENNHTPRFRSSVLLPEDKKRTLGTTKSDTADTMATRMRRLSPLVQENGRLSSYCTMAVAVASLCEVIWGKVRDTVTNQVQITLLATQVLGKNAYPLVSPTRQV